MIRAIAFVCTVVLLAGTARGAEPTASPSPLLVAPGAMDAERAAHTGYRVTLKLTPNDQPVAELERIVRANEMFSIALEPAPHWRLQLVAAPAGAGRIRLLGKIEAGVPPRIISEPELMLSESIPGTIVVTTPDGASQFKAELVLTPVEMSSEIPAARAKRLSPDMHPTPLAPERPAPPQPDGGNGAPP
jgi:hypothetical protein